MKRLINLPVLAEVEEYASAEAWLESHGPRCGPCRACCTVKSVREALTSTYEPCRHECAGGCAIYAERPGPCREYACLWRSGILAGDERRRPDNLGLIIEAGGDEGHRGPSFLLAWEVWPGAAGGPAADWLLRQLTREGLVLVRLHGGGRAYMLGHPELMALWQGLDDWRPGGVVRPGEVFEVPVWAEEVGEGGEVVRTVITG
jgi:hypothetical protein